jgi:CPA2 family monovalent cation:H+ antiporter-2
MMWHLLMEVVLILSIAFVLGAVAQKLKQSAIIGYLIAGAVVGPLLFNTEAVRQVAELGVALLLFSIGLEFSFSRLKNLGSIALVGGTLQVSITLAIFALLLIPFLNISTSVALGAMAALSSTAVVLRVLVDRAAIDSVYGRNALGMLLLQDIAVVPLVLLVSVLTQGGGAGDIALQLGRSLGAALLLVAAFYLLFYHLVPRILMAQGLFANRELVVLLAIIIALGSVWVAHSLGLSPALGAFLAGMLLAESPFATQIRSDIVSIRTLFVTLFFTSVGMLAEPLWLVQHLHWVVAGLVLVFGIKALIIFLIARYFDNGAVQSLATGFALAQVGEFSFVLAAAAHEGALISSDLLALVLSVTILSLLLAPYMVVNAEKWAELVLTRIFRGKGLQPKPTHEHPASGQMHVLIIGFGPAGQQVAEALANHDVHSHVIELNPHTASKARQMGLHVHIGDATSRDVLNHVGIQIICAAVITLPDPKTCRDVIANLRFLLPDIPILTRSRYHRYLTDLQNRGATVVVDEESVVGETLANDLIALMSKPGQEAMACALSGERWPVVEDSGPDEVS